MAETVTEICNHPKKNSKIIVNVEEVLTDILVVSFTFNSKLFQGVLLDSSKKLLPCGIVAPTNVLPPLGTAVAPEDDKLYSASQRYSYFQEKPQTPPVDLLANGRIQLKRNIRPPARFKNARMTVRLRPRQVLCSKCRGICNENSENVDLSSKKRKNPDTATGPPPTKITRGDRKLRSSGDISPIFKENQKEITKKNTWTEVPPTRGKKFCPTLIPKISRLQPTEISSAMNGQVKLKLVSNCWVKGEKCEEKSDREVSEMTDNKLNASVNVNVNGSEDPLAFETDPLSIPLTDVKLSETQCKTEVTVTVTADSDTKFSEITRIPVETNCDVHEIDTERTMCDDKTTSFDVEEQDPLALAQDEEDDGDTSSSSAKRTLRKKRSVGSMEDLWDETVFEEPTGKFIDKKLQNTKSRTTPVIKISFGSATGEGTVLKIPAKVQNYIPVEADSDEKKKEKTKRDASAKAAKKALKKAKKEARRKILGSNSPVRSLGSASPRYQNLSPRYAISCSSPRYNLANASSPAYEIFHTRRHKHKVKHKKRHKEERKHRDDENIREQCLKQKLSISLKRLNANAYMRCESSSSGSKSPSPSNSEASDDHSEGVPDFPGSPLMVRISTQTINTCQTSDGRSMAVGDVVWGKIHGFPWWPGKVLSMTMSRKEDGACMTPQAHVAWYGSSTSSLMSCDQLNPFLETFQMRYNKRKRGPYKEAIKQATTEAKRGEEINLSSSSPVYSSPSEVDVVS